MATLAVKIDPSGAQQGARVVKRSLEDMAGAAAKAEKAIDGVSQSSDEAGKSAGRARDQFGRFVRAENDAANGARVVKRSADDMAKAFDSAGSSAARFGDAANDNLRRIQHQVDANILSFRTLMSVMGPLAALFSVQALTGYADAWSDMQSRVGAAVKDMEAAPELMQRMVDIANASYAPLNQTVEVYARNVAVLADLGRGATEAADFTEALNHALVLTATRGERAASVQNALSKAMAVGNLQADGLETVLANGGEVAQALADELNTTVNGLRKMASDGKITGDVIASALINRLADLRDRAAEMPATIGDAFVRMGTNLTAFIGQADKASSVSERLAGILLIVADNIGAVILAIGSLALGHVAAMVASLGTQMLTLAARAGAANVALGLLANTVRLMGGPVGFVFSTMAMYIGYMETRTTETDRATQALRESVADLDAAYTGPQDKLDGMLESTRELAKMNIKTALDAAEKQLAELERQFKAVHLSDQNLLRMDFQDAGLSALVRQLQQGKIAVSEYIGEVMKLGDANPALAEFARRLGEGNSDIIQLAQEAANARQRMEELGIAGNGAAAGIANSGNAAAAAAGQYHTAGAAAAGYAANLRALGALIPAVAAQQQAQSRLTDVETRHTVMMAESKRLLDSRNISLDQYAARVVETNSLVEQARSEVTGLASAERELAAVTQNNVIGALDGQARAVAQVRAEYDQRAETIRQSVKFGADEAAASALLEKNSSELEKALTNVNTQFEKTGSSGRKAGGGASAAAKGIKEAAQAADEFTSRADRLAEAMFPAEYARMEAMELMDLLDRLGSKLTDLQRIAVETEIDNLFTAAEQGVRRLDDQVGKSGKNMAKSLGETLGSALSDIFSKPIEDLDDFVDRVMSAFAQLGQQNLQNVFDNLFGTGPKAANDNIAPAISRSIEKGAEKGTAKGGWAGIIDGFMSIFGGGQQQGQTGGVSGMGNMASIGLGALGMGYQSASPVMGALSGAMSGMAGGPVGMAIGAIAGLVGGIFGRNSQKKQERRQAQEQLEQQLGAITELIATATGDFVGEFQKAYLKTTDELNKAIQLAKKAGDGELAKELEAAVDTFFNRLQDRWVRGFDGMIAALNSGQGFDGAFASGVDSIEKMREQLVGFVNDARFFAEGIDATRRAAKEEAAPSMPSSRAQIDFGHLSEPITAIADYRKAADQYADTLQKIGLDAYNMTPRADAGPGGAPWMQDLTKTEAFSSVEALRAKMEELGVVFDKLGNVISGDELEAMAQAERDRLAEMERAEKAAQNMARSLLRGADEFSEMELAIQKLDGVAAGLPSVLQDLGMSATEAAKAVEEDMIVALDKLREDFTKGMDARLNEATGKGYINALNDLVEAREMLLRDAAALGMSAAIVEDVFLAEAEEIVSGTDMTAEALRDLAAEFPVLSDFVEKTVQDMREAFTRGLDDRLNAANDNGYLTQLRDLMEERDTLREQAADLGLEAALLEQVVLTEARKIIEGADDAAFALRSLAETFPDLSAVLDDVLAKLRSELIVEMQTSINSLSGAGFMNEFAEAQDTYLDRLRESIHLGIDAGLATQEMNLQIARIARNADLTDDALRQLAVAFPMLSDGLLALIGAASGPDLAAANDNVDRARSDLRAAYDEEARSIQSVIDRTERFISTIRKFRDDMRLNETVSPLSPQERLQEAARQFSETAALAMSGDEEAQAKLAGISQSYLDEARSYYASSTEYMRIWEEVDGTLGRAETLAGRQLSNAEQQLQALKSQVQHLIDIDTSVMSVEAAIYALNGALSAQAAAQRAAINAAKAAEGSGGGAGGGSGGVQYHGSDPIAKLYHEHLGRAPDAGGYQFWMGHLALGAPLAEIAKEFEKLSGLPGYSMGGFTGNMPTSAIAGYVHGQEFVANAEATRRWRPQFEAANAGRNPFDMGAVVAELREVKRELAELRSGQDRQTATVALHSQHVAQAVERGNDITREGVSVQRRKASAA